MLKIKKLRRRSFYLVILVITLLFSIIASAGYLGANLTRYNARYAWASSVLARTQEQSFDADLACDNNIDTRWDSNHDERVSWIAFDYEKVQYISTVLIIWEQAHATTYAIEYSNDAENWREIWKEYEGDGNIDLIQFTTHVRARYLRLKCTQKANDDWGYSVYEFQAFGKH